MTGTYPIVADGKQIGELTVSKEGMFTRFDAACTDTGSVMRLSIYGESEGYLGVMLPENGVLRLTKSLSKLGLAGFPEHPTHAGEAGQGAPAVPAMAVKPPERQWIAGEKQAAAPGLGFEEEPAAIGEPVAPERPAVPERPAAPEEAAPPERQAAASKPPAAPQKGAELERDTEYIDFSRWETPEPKERGPAQTGPAPEPEPAPSEMAAEAPPAESAPAPKPEAVPECGPGLEIQCQPETSPELSPVPECESEPEREPQLEQDAAAAEPGPETFLWKREPGGALSCVHGELRLLALPYNTPRLPMDRVWETRTIEGRRYAIFKIENGKIL